MFRVQSCFPAKSYATKSPVEKKKITRLPSVAGEGEAKLLFWSRRYPCATFSLHTILPVDRSIQNAIIFCSVLSPDETKTRSSQTAGVAALGPGKSTLQSTFSAFENFAGRFFSGVEPLKF